MKKLKGSITIFLVCIFAVSIIFYTSFADVIRYRSAMTAAESVGMMEANVEGMFMNNEYVNIIGFSFYSPQCEPSNEIVEAIMGSNMIGDSDITYEKSVAYYTIGEDSYLISSMLSRYAQFGDTEESLSDRLRVLEEMEAASTKASSVLAEFTVDYARVSEYFANGFYRMFYDYFCNYAPDGNATLANANSAMTESDMGLLEELSCALYSFDQNHLSVLPEERTQYFTDANYLWVYTKDYLTNYQSKTVGASGLRCECEYILFGYSDDYHNMAAVCEQIMESRFAANAYSISQSGLAITDDELTNWALNEAYYDTLCLLEGGRVKPLKEVSAFATTGDTNPEEIVAGEGGAGLSYEDYLYYLLLFPQISDPYGRISEGYARLVNWVECATGVDANEIALVKEVSITTRSKIEPVSMMGYLMNGWAERTKVYKLGQ